MKLPHSPTASPNGRSTSNTPAAPGQHYGSAGHTPLSSADLQDIRLLELVSQDGMELNKTASTNGGEWSGPCPGCGGEDRFNVWPDHPSGRGRFWCRRCGKKGDAIDYLREFRGLSYNEALEALGLHAPQSAGANAHHRNGASSDHRPSGSRIVTEYHYLSEDGTHLYDVVRFNDPKEYKPRRPDGSWSYGDVERVLYRLPEVVEAVAAGNTVFLVEGEKTAEALRSRGLVATTISGGANAKWSPQFTEALTGAHVVILPDQDDPGHLYGKRVAGELESTAANLKVIDLPGLEYRTSHGLDPEDWFSQGHTTEELWELVKDAPPWRRPYEIALPNGRRLPLLTLDELEALPPLEYIVDGIVPRGAVCMMYAPAQAGKTFLALHWALELAQTDGVIYLAAEGLAGLGVRARGWRTHYGKAGTHLRTIPGMIPLMDMGAVDAFIEGVSPLKPKLIVIDTLSASVPGADDSDSKDMRTALANCRAIAAGTGAAVVLLHHSLKSDAATYRGSTVLMDDVDVVVYLDRRARSGHLTLKSVKSKDSRPFDDRHYQLAEVELADGATTRVIVPLDSRETTRASKLKPRHEEMLRIVAQAPYDTEGITTGDLGMKANVPQGSLAREINGLIEMGYLEQPTKRGPYFITEAGREVLGLE